MKRSDLQTKIWQWVGLMLWHQLGTTQKERTKIHWLKSAFAYLQTWRKVHAIYIWDRKYLSKHRHLPGNQGKWYKWGMIINGRHATFSLSDIYEWWDVMICISNIHELMYAVRRFAKLLTSCLLKEKMWWDHLSRNVQCHSQAMGHRKRCDETAFHKMCNVAHLLLVIGKDAIRLPFTKYAMSLTNCWLWGKMW